MSIVSGVVVYVITWWVVLFAVLPFGVNRNQNQADGTDPGAPEKPKLWQKALWTSGITAIIWVIIYLIVESNWISFRS